uniref:Uncharacterized protein n=1 Tax=Ananas comosus var. bracteatus TaxID=296719 RepID=A0A6V7P1T4_ANACO|nr:unnamed protein product [Ananas comosus var. bracteatus]
MTSHCHLQTSPLSCLATTDRPLWGTAISSLGGKALSTELRPLLAPPRRSRANLGYGHPREELDPPGPKEASCRLVFIYLYNAHNSHEFITQSSSWPIGAPSTHISNPSMEGDSNPRGTVCGTPYRLSLGTPNRLSQSFHVPRLRSSHYLCGATATSAEQTV